MNADWSRRVSTKKNKKEVSKMIHKLAVVSLVVGVCLMGVTSALAYDEAPVLRTKVAAGEIPPVEERLPEEPKVVGLIEEIGQYGGTLRAFGLNNLPWCDLGESPERGSYLLRINEDLTIVGDIAKGYELSDDERSFTLYLRKGMKWSDGAPFTTDDILFMYEDMHWNDKVTTWGVLEPVTRIKKIDDYTVRFESDEPFSRIIQAMITWRGGGWTSFQPKHYLKKWHIKYNSKADELAKKEGFENWWEAFYYHYWWAPQKDLNKPTLQPWMFKESTTSYKVFERNPYYHVVDTAGNQLPYIDRIVINIVDAEIYQLKVIAGEADVAYMATNVASYPLYKENEQTGGYRVVTIPGLKGAEQGLGINQNSPDPALRELFQDVRFRQALSLAINREEINETCYFGLGVPRQATVLSSASYYKKEWGEAYAEYDPDEANRLLDEVGLTERDKDGFRIGRDGKSVLLLVEYREYLGIPSSFYELIKEYWESVGVKVLLKLEDASLHGKRVASPDHGIIARAMDNAEEVSNYAAGAGMWSATDGHWGWAWNWGLWLNAEEAVRTGRKVLEDFPGGKLPGEEPPQEIKELKELIARRNSAKLGSKEYRELSQKVFDFHAMKVYIIGSVGMVPTIYIAKNNVGNVPKGPLPGSEDALSLNHLANQLFFK